MAESRLKQLDHFLGQKLFRLVGWMNNETARMEAYIDRMDEEERLRPIEKLGRSLKVKETKPLMAYIPHPHWFKLISDENDHDWGGLICRRRIWFCRLCLEKRVKMSGSMPL